MHILVTTSQSLLLLDTESGEITPMDRGRGLYYGIACDGETIYVAARRRLVSSACAQHDERGEILMFDRLLTCRGSLQAPFPLADIDPSLHVACAGTACARTDIGSANKIALAAPSNSELLILSICDFSKVTVSGAGRLL